MLAGGAAATAGGFAAFAYGTDNPLHRSSVTETATRSAGEPPAPGAFWAATHAADVPDVNATQLVGVRYLGGSSGTADEVAVDVLAVAVGRQSVPLGSGGSLGAHRLGVRGVGESGTRGVDSGEGDMLASGVVRPPRAVAEATGLDRSALDDPGAVREHVVPEDRFEAGRDVALAHPLLAAFERESDGLAAGRLTLAGAVGALISNGTAARAATPEYEGRGESYRWPLGDVFAHAVRYRGLYVRPGGDRAGLKVASAVPRPSLLGSPRVEGALRVSFAA